MASQADAAFEELLEYLKRQRGFDFTGYKPVGLMRRVRKRMAEVGTADFDAYRDYLEVHPDEFALLFNTILINVTDFFRDTEAWTRIAEEFIPRILRGKRSDQPIRVWSAGCSTGEEPYTLMILLVEALGPERFKEQVKIYATDVDDEALARARQGSYTAAELENVPEALRERYFEPSGSRFVVRPDLRRSVIFGRLDLASDAPISRLDLLVCRNTLMYFTAEAQSRILARLHLALNDSGYLFLGRAEMLLTRSNLFVPADLKPRIFTKVPKPTPRERLLLLNQAGGPSEPAEAAGAAQTPLLDLALELTPVAQLVIDRKGALVAANQQARQLFRLDERDVGRPFRDLEASYRPIELRSRIEEAHAEGRPVFLAGVKYPYPGGTTRRLDVQVIPLQQDGHGSQGVSITLTDVTRDHRLQEELQQANQNLETAFEELETTNEELQSTNEELETTNEELQSTNEELETMNEELHSTNEELETINDELRRRTEELNRVNGYLESILAGLHTGAVVLDRELRVQIWNARAEDLWGVRAEEALGESFLGLDIGLPVGALRQPLHSCLAGDDSVEAEVLPATNRRGRGIECRVTCTPLRRNGDTPWGVILLMEEWPQDGGGR
ncbi:MAG TPA: CheR family methyltransferase [Longimicrobiaceae bacterium]|nr:CheR family methyltransferase [Longimicrobiaceae bacterium]